MKPIVIAVAITGSVPRKKDNPAVPTTPAEQVESSHEAFEAGATLVHIHVRNDDESPSSDPERFRQVQEGVRRHCPGMIVQFSTGGRGRDPGARGSAPGPGRRLGSARTRAEPLDADHRPDGALDLPGTERAPQGAAPHDVPYPQ